MRKFLGSLVQNKIKRPQDQECLHMILHEDMRMSKLISYSRDYCSSCNEHMCNVCSEVHVGDHCSLRLATYSHPAQGKLQIFNRGYLVKLKIQGLKCICGTNLDLRSENHAICVACGMASCSIACHREWEKAGNCTYHTNFYNLPPERNMRTIVLRNIFNIQKAKISTWSIANKTALSYVACYAHSKFDYVYLQRGYRNYGVPQKQLIDRLEPQFYDGLDFITHVERSCSCECLYCTDRHAHSVGNCQMDCSELKGSRMNYVSQAVHHFECGCDCSFCHSGLVVSRHTDLDCMFHCKRKIVLE